MNALVTKAEATQKRANLADRLVNGLSSEGKRWKEDVGKLSEQMRRRGTFAPLPPARHGLAIAAVRAMYIRGSVSDAGGMARERLGAIARAPSSCPSRPRPWRASASAPRTAPRARLKRPSDARSAERGEGFLALRCRPWLRVRRRLPAELPYAATAGPAAFEASERRAE